MLRGALFLIVGTLTCAHAQDPLDAPTSDLYSVGKDGGVATVDGHNLMWSDFGAFLIQGIGTASAHGQMQQLLYTSILRRELTRHGLVVTRRDVERELVRANENSLRSAGRDPASRSLEEYLAEVEQQTGKDRRAFAAFNWGFAAQSKIVDHLWPEAARREYYASGENPGLGITYTGAHILFQTLGGKRTREDARARADRAAERLAKGEDWNQVAWELNDDFRALPRAYPPPGPGLAAGTVYGWLGEFRPRGCPFGKEMADQAAALAAGGTSGVFESPWGFHILKLVDKKVPPYEAEAYRIHGLLSGRLLEESKARARIKLHILEGETWTLEPFAGQDVVVAEVDGEKLWLSDFGRLIYLNWGPREGGSFLGRLISEYALYLTSQDLGVEITPAQVEAKILADYFNARGAAASPQPTREQIDAYIRTAVAGSRTSVAQYRVTQRDIMRRAATLDALTTPDRVRTYFEGNPQRFTAKLRTRTVRLHYFDKRRTREEAEALAREVLGKLEAARAALPPERRGHPDEDYFALLVEAYSEDPISKRRGGADGSAWPMGLRGQAGSSGLGVVFEEAAFAAGKGGAGMAEIHGGYAVFEVLEAEPAPSLEEATPRIIEEIREGAAIMQLQARQHHVVEDPLGLAR